MLIVYKDVRVIVNNSEQTELLGSTVLEAVKKQFGMQKFQIGDESPMCPARKLVFLVGLQVALVAWENEHLEIFDADHRPQTTAELLKKFE